MSDNGQTFTITEIPAKRAGSGPDAATRFEWTAVTRTMPRGSWNYGVKLRTSRTDYPGADIPTVQVMGSHLEPQTLAGVWDDRYAGPGFAKATLEAFQEMQRRGNLVRIQWSFLDFTGYITGFQPTVFRGNRIGYSFTFDPLYTDPNGDTRKDAKQAPKASESPDTSTALAQSLADEAAAIHGLADGYSFADNSYAVAGALVANMTARAAAIAAMVAVRVLDAVSVAQLVTQFQGMAAAAAALLVPLTGLRSDTGTVLDRGDIAIGFDAWSKGLRDVAYRIVLQANQSAKIYASSLSPDVQAFYRPRAGESLYAIAQAFLGDPFRAQEIAERNGLFSMELDGTELLLIPQNATGV